MDLDTDRKIALLHTLSGLLLGVGFAYYPEIAGRPILFVILLGLIISYPLRLLSIKLFNLSLEEFTIKSWLAKGFFLFITTWILVWILVFNLR
jgi:hypothetical protein|tara:strand:+ start:486 stop:764 length:279 start_codon:yes stop_codon:yes gene_type:complete